MRLDNLNLHVDARGIGESLFSRAAQHVKLFLGRTTQPLGTNGHYLFCDTEGAFI